MNYPLCSPFHASAKETLITQSATNPRTRLEVDAFRTYRLTNPDWKILVTTTHVCRSYPRWANIGLTPKVMPFTIPIAILATRRTQEEKQIWVLDPTNAHFYENVSSPKEGIFYDVAEVVRKNIHYAIKCSCPDSSTCTCSDGWTIDFIKCREHPEIAKGYPSIIDSKGVAWIYQFIYLWTFDNFVRNEKRDDDMSSKPWEDEDTCDMMTMTKELIDDNEVKLRMGKGVPYKAEPVLVNQFQPLSIVHCENCGRDENPDCVLKRCARCKNVRYCSLKCQKRDWPRHKEGCLLPMKDIGGGIKLVPREYTTFDPVTQQLSFKLAEKKPKLERKVKKNKKKGKD